MLTKKTYLAVAIALTASQAPLVLAEDSFGIEEIIVTATKRAESVQDIPLAVTALDAYAIDQRGISDIESLASSVPGLHFSQAGSDTRITVRGIGSEQNTVTGDPGVAFHIDGVYQSRASAGSALFYDLQRIEVLRGPQGTLYGRNATGGSINLISARPENATTGKLALQVGNYNQQQINGVFNTPLIDDRLLMRISAQQQTRDGFYDNKAAGADDLDDVDSLNLRTQFLYLPNDQVDVLLSLNYSSQGGNGDGGRVVGAYTPVFLPINQITSGLAAAPAPFGAGLAIAGPASANPTGDRDIRTNAAHDRDNERMGASITVTWDLGNVAFKSISAWQDNLVDAVRDVDFSDAEALNEFRRQDSTQYSQEFQLSSTDDSSLQWIVGAYWLTEQTEAEFWLFDDGTGLSALRYNDPFFPAPAVASFLNGLSVFGTVDTGLGFNAMFGNDSTINSDTVGLFGQAAYNVNEDLTITAGLRWSEDKKDADIRYKGFGNNLVVPESSFSKKDSWEAVTYKLSADWFVGEDTLLYATVSSGFKSGGFLQDPTSLPYDEEEVLAYELGSKSQFFQGRMQANISAFYYDYDDLQLSTILNNQLVTTNAGKAKVTGIELELLATPLEALEVSASIASTRAKFVDYKADDPLLAGIAESDLDGNDLARSPDWTVNLAAAYTVALNYGELTFSANMFWSDEVYFSAFNRSQDDSDYQSNYRTTDVRIHFASQDGNWFMALAAKNLENELVASNANSRSSLGGTNALLQYQAPRTYSLSAGYNF